MGIDSTDDVKIAIARFFDGEPPPDPDPPVPPPQATRRQETLAHGFNDIRSRARTRLEPAPRVVGQPENRISPRPPLLLTAILTPLNIALGLVSRLYTFLSYLFPPLARLLHRLRARPTSTLHQGNDARPALNPHDTAVRFQREFAAAYGEHPLPLMECSYARAYDIAKQDFKFLLVIPVSPEHADTDSFVRDILLSPPVVEYITTPENHILLWAGSMADSEPYQVARSLNLAQFPAAVLVANTGSATSPSMSIVTRIVKPGQPQEFVATLQAAITQHASALAQSRSTRTEQQATRSLRDEQNSAYERSLAKDREKMRAKKAAEEQRKQTELAEKEVQDREKQYTRDLAAWKRWRASTLAAEPSKETRDVVRTSIRLLDGEKVMRRFPADASLEDAYAFVECYVEVKAAQKSGEVNEKAPIKPAPFEHQYGFQLVSPLPRAVYDLAAGGTVLERFGRSANLIAEQIEGDDSDTES